jgi:hypothetical protein
MEQPFTLPLKGRSYFCNFHLKKNQNCHASISDPLKHVVTVYR